MPDPTDSPRPQRVRKLLLRVLVGFLVLTAVIAIIDVWTDVDEDGRILVSSFIISMTCLLALSGAALLDRQPNAAPGLASLVISALAGLLSLYLVWVEPRGEQWFRLLASAWLWSLTFSLHSLLSLAGMPARLRWLEAATPAVLYLAGAVATAAIYELLGQNDTVYYLLATLYILATLGSLIMLITHLMHRHEQRQPKPEALILVPLPDDPELFEDMATQRRYRVLEIDD